MDHSRYNKKVTIKQPFQTVYNVENLPGHTISNEDLYEHIDLNIKDIESYIRNFFIEYSYNDEFKSLCEDVVDIEFSIDYTTETMILVVYMNTQLDTSTIEDSLHNILSDLFGYDELSGSFSMDIEPTESEPYESGYNPLKDEIVYSTDTIDELNVSYSIEVPINEDTIEID